MEKKHDMGKSTFTYQLRGAFRAYEIALGRFLQAFDLPLSHFYVLRIFWEKSGHTQKYISDQAFMSESVLSQVLKKMIDRELVTRLTQDLNFTQARKIILTPKGEKLRHELLEGHELLLQSFLELENEAEVKQVIEILSSVGERLRQLNQQK